MLPPKKMNINYYYCMLRSNSIRMLYNNEKKIYEKMRNKCASLVTFTHELSSKTRLCASDTCRFFKFTVMIIVFCRMI